jgi:hypothetical protein
MRWHNGRTRQATNRGVVENPPAFLATTTTRMCINSSQSAQSRRETYVGPWLPEPVDTSSDPTLGAERGEALGLAILLLLEKLSPTERAAYVFREAFDYSHREIADILQIQEANARQLVSRAAHTGKFRGAAAPSGGFYRCCPKGRSGCAGRSLRRKCGLLFGWRWCCTHGSSGPGFWSRARCEVHRLLRLTFLDGHDAYVD